MNLCGGIVSLGDADQLLLEIPDEKFQLNPRRKASSSLPSRRKAGAPGPLDTNRGTLTEQQTSSSSMPLSGKNRTSRASESPTAAASPTFLNPLSKDDLKKSLNRPRTTAPPIHLSSKSSGMIKRLEGGFNVTLLSAGGDRRPLYLDVNAEKTHLRVRAREDNSDSENEEFQSNFSPILLKVADISRLEVGREKVPRTNSASPRQVRSFSIVLRKQGGHSNTYNFDADSPHERDTIIGGIKDVLESSRRSSECRHRRSSNSPSLLEVAGRSTPVSERKATQNSAETKSTTTHITKKADVYFDFDLPNDGPEAAIEAEMRNDCSAKFSDGGNRDGAPCGQRDVDISSSRDLAITVKETSVEVAGARWTVDDIFCGLAITGTSPEATSPKTSDMTMKGQYETLCSPVGGCNAQALAAVEDGDLAAMGIHDVSAGPFCTDDVCTATLKDFTDTMKGIFEMKQISRNSKPLNEQHKAMAGDFVSGMMGAQSTVAANLLSVQDIFAPIPEKRQLPKKRVIRNRCGSRGAQAARFARLRRQMTFTESNETMPFVQVVNSYDDVDRAGRFVRKLKSGEIVKGPQNDSSKFLQAVVQNMELQGSNYHDEDILYYDSDPEEVREIALCRGPRRALANIVNAEESAKPRKEALSNIPMSFMNFGRRLKRVDDDTITEIIDTMKNEKMHLIWHPSQQGNMPNRAPLSSKVWIEAGIYLIDGTFLLPKLAWVPFFEENLQSKLLNVTVSQPGTIDLLDVCRVRGCTSIDRSIHPYANLDCSFIIQTQKEILLFEAQSKDERIRIVKALRLVIARLASLLMLRDLRAVDEFFGGNSVPGEAPVWAQGKIEKADKGTILA